MISQLTSRKFLLTVATVVFAVAGVLSGHLTYDQAANIIQVAVGAYLAAEGATDALSAYGAAKSGTSSTTKTGGEIG